MSAMLIIVLPRIAVLGPASPGHLQVCVLRFVHLHSGCYLGSPPVPLCDGVFFWFAWSVSMLYVYIISDVFVQL